MVFGYFLLCASLFFLGYASYTDLKGREVADEISVGFLVSALSIRLAWFLATGEEGVFLPALLVSFAFLLISIAMYFSRQWGGGDLLILTALGAAFGTLPPEFPDRNGPLPLWAGIFINVFFIGAVYGIIWIFSFLLTRKDVLRETCGKIAKYWFVSAPIFLAGALSAIYMDFIGKAFGASLVLLYFALLSSKSAENIVFTRKTLPENLQVEDWIVGKVTSKGRPVVNESTTGLTKDDIERIVSLSKRGLLDQRKVSVKEGIPFVPVFFLSLLVSLFLGNPVSWIVSLPIGL